MKRNLFYFLLLVMIFSLSSSAFAFSDEEYKTINSVVKRHEVGSEKIVMSNDELFIIATGCEPYATFDKIEKKNAYSMALMDAKREMAQFLYGTTIKNSTFTTKTNEKNGFQSVITYDVYDNVEEQIISVTIIALSPLKLLEELKKTANNVLNYLSSGGKYIVVETESESSTFASALGEAYEYAIWFILKDINGLPANNFFEKTLFLHAISKGVFANVTDLDFSTEITHTGITNTANIKIDELGETVFRTMKKAKIKMRVWIDREKFKESVLYALNPKFYDQFTSESNVDESLLSDETLDSNIIFLSSYCESGVLKNLFQIEHFNKNVLNQK